jgi:enoyl-CoA hydratase
MTPEVRFEVEHGIAVLTISNPSIKNALTLKMSHQLTELCERIDADQSIGAVVVRGDGGTFCSGADTRTWSGTYADPMSDSAYAETDDIYGAFYRVGQIKVPTISAVRGAAVGAGLNLALATDLRIVAEDARLIAGFLKAGIHPGGGFFTISSRVAGREAAAAMGVFSEEVSGTRAVQVGLAWEAAADDAVEARALELAGRVAGDPVLARRVAKSFRAEADPSPLPWSTAIEVERGVQIWTQARRLRSDVEGEGR